MRKIIAFFLVFVSVFVNTFSVSAQTDIVKTTDENGCRIGVEMLIDGKCENPSRPDSLYKWAKKNGFTTTKNVEDFNLLANITREEVSAIIARGFQNGIFQDVKIADGVAIDSFLDQNQIAPEFIETAKFVQDRGIVRGDNGYFRPKRNISMYESVIVLLRSVYMGHDNSMYEDAVRKIVKKEHLNDVAKRGEFFYFTRLLTDENVSKWHDQHIEISQNINTGLGGDISSDKMRDYMKGKWSFVYYRQWDYEPKKIPAGFTLNITDNKISYYLCWDSEVDIVWNNNSLAVYDNGKVWYGGDCTGLHGEVRSFFNLTRAEFSGFQDNGKDYLAITTKDRNIYYLFERK